MDLTTIRLLQEENARLKRELAETRKALPRLRQSVYQSYGIIRLMRTSEKTISVDHALYSRANRKFRRYGHSLDAAVALFLQTTLATRGDPLESLDLEFGSADEAIAYLHDYVQNRP